MHNLHFLVLQAETPQEACEMAANEIMDFGNEDNYHSICGCVSEKNEVFINDSDGRYCPDESDDTIEKINKTVKGWIKNNMFAPAARKKINKTKGKIDLSKWNTTELYSLECLARHYSEINQLENKGKNFNVLTDSFYAYKYNQCGVTQLNNIDADGYETYVVFIDMHD